MMNRENDNKSLMKVSQVAMILGISRSLTYRMIQQGLIPSVTIGHCKRVRPCDLEEYIQRNWSGWVETSGSNER